MATKETAQILELYKKVYKTAGTAVQITSDDKVPTGLGDAISHAYSQVQQGGRLHALRETLKLQESYAPIAALEKLEIFIVTCHVQQERWRFLQ